MTSPDRSEYKGSKRQLVLSLDVGTTFSGISYCILDPGRVPEILAVTRFPAQEHITGAAKIPTIIYYDRAGKVRAVGAEATQDGIYQQAAEENWIKAEWFKLHLRPKFGHQTDYWEDIPPLPLNMSVVDVLADFLKYLLECAAAFIQDTHANGRVMWESVKADIKYVLSHPNGWEGSQQSRMRKAGVKGGLIPNTAEGRDRLSFVTEGEASLHFAIHNGLPVDAMKKGAGVIIVDAGGGTINISSYIRKVGAWTEKFAEVAATQCHLQGSVFVTLHARSFLEKLLGDSNFIEDIDHIVRCFDRSTKHRFKTDKDPQYIQFGRLRDNDDKYNIRFGQLKLDGTEVARFFQPAIDHIVQAVMEQQKAAQKQLEYVIMLGGFSANDWLFDHVSSALSSEKLQVIRPTNHVNKAVSDGGISFYLDNLVHTRVSKVVYGTDCAVPYDPNNRDHQSRLAHLYTDLSGFKLLRGAFDTILGKDIPVLETKEFRKSYNYLTDTNLKRTVLLPQPIICYRGAFPNPSWMDVDAPNYTELCRIPVDLSQVPITRHMNGSSLYFRAKFDVILLFGRTELKAQISWMENGVEVRSTPQIVYDPDC